MTIVNLIRKLVSSILFLSVLMTQVVPSAYALTLKQDKKGNKEEGGTMPYTGDSSRFSSQSDHVSHLNDLLDLSVPDHDANDLVQESANDKTRNDRKSIDDIAINTPESQMPEWSQPYLDYEVDLATANSSSSFQTTTNNTFLPNWRTALELDSAWSISRGQGITIAVIDYGINWRHDDLIANVWTNSGEIPDNGIDDDRNGYVDDVHGWDFGNNDSDASAELSEAGGDFSATLYHHGTMTAGIIGALDNDFGITGIAPKSKLMPIRVNAVGRENPAAQNIHDAIRYAVNNGADIVNMTLTFPSISNASRSLIDNAVQYAEDNGVIIVASAGNGGNSADTSVQYPSSSDYVISVGAVNEDLTRRSSSSFGGTLDFVGLGENVTTLAAHGSAELDLLINGGDTSVSSPMLSGVVALMLAGNRSLNYDEIMRRLSITAQDIGPSGRDNQTGYGLVNAFNAVAVNYDVSGDGYVSPIDALQIINHLDSDAPNNEVNPSLPRNHPESVARLDINGDNYVSPIDALIPINFMSTDLYTRNLSRKYTNDNTPYSPAASPEGEGPSPSLTAQEVLDMISPLARLIGQDLSVNYRYAIFDANHNGRYDATDLAAMADDLERVVSRSEYDRLLETGIRHEIRNAAGQIVQVNVFNLETGEQTSTEYTDYHANGNARKKSIYDAYHRLTGREDYDWYGRLYADYQYHENGRLKSLQYFNVYTNQAYFSLRYHSSGYLAFYEYRNYWSGRLYYRFFR